MSESTALNISSAYLKGTAGVAPHCCTPSASPPSDTGGVAHRGGCPGEPVERWHECAPSLVSSLALRLAGATCSTRLPSGHKSMVEKLSLS